MDKNIDALVQYCKLYKLSERGREIHYKYVLDKFVDIEFEFDFPNILELLIRPKEYLENLFLLEKYKRRNLKPIQFAKEKEKDLAERLDKHLDYLKSAQADKDKERVAELKIEIEEIKNLIQAHKEKIKRIKLEK